MLSLHEFIFYESKNKGLDGLLIDCVSRGTARSKENRKILWQRRSNNSTSTIPLNCNTQTNRWSLTHEGLCNSPCLGNNRGRLQPVMVR